MFGNQEAQFTFDKFIHAVLRIHIANGQLRKLNYTTLPLSSSPPPFETSSGECEVSAGVQGRR